MAAHAAFSLATTVDVYFAHPHSPWGRGTNEKPNGLLREYFPKGTEITDDQTYLDPMAHELNRPRRIPGYRIPAEVFPEPPGQLDCYHRLKPSRPRHASA